ncbi:hypothetical protein DITRI_Ditri02bG0074500 [Diplodiscus trichospermus]
MEHHPEFDIFLYFPFTRTHALLPPSLSSYPLWFDLLALSLTGHSLTGTAATPRSPPLPPFPAFLPHLHQSLLLGFHLLLPILCCLRVLSFFIDLGSSSWQGRLTIIAEFCNHKLRKLIHIRQAPVIVLNWICLGFVLGRRFNPLYKLHRQPTLNLDENSSKTPIRCSKPPSVHNYILCVYNTLPSSTIKEKRTRQKSKNLPSF